MALDLTGQTFGRLTVLNQAGIRGGRITWTCMCECGKTITSVGTNLKSGCVKSCGCLLADLRKKSFKSLIGLKFGRLTVLNQAETRHRQSYWNCRCDCGSETVVNGGSLRCPIGSKHRTVSCGCFNRERAREQGFKNSITYYESLIEVFRD